VSTGVFICSAMPECGASVVTLGMVRILQRTIGSVGYFKPVGAGCEDTDVQLMRGAFNLSEKPDALCPVANAAARDVLARGRLRELLDPVTAAYCQLRENKHFVVVGGITNQRPANSFDLEIDEAVARRIETPVLLVARGYADADDSGVDAAVTAVLSTKREFEEKGCEVVGAVVNRAPQRGFLQAVERFKDAFERAGVALYGVMPELPFLGFPKLDQIVSALDGRVLRGGQHLANAASKIIIGAMEPHNFLRHIDTDGVLVIMPGDRTSNLIALAAAHKAERRHNLSGVILTGGLLPEPEVVRLIDDLGVSDIPLISVQTDTFTTADQVRRMNVRIRPQDADKLQAATSAFAQYVDHERLWTRLEMPRPRRKPTSASFLDDLLDRARAAQRHIVLPEGDEPRTIRAVGRLRELDICRVTLLGKPDAIQAAAHSAGVLFDDGVCVLDPRESRKWEAYVSEVVRIGQARKGGMTAEVAEHWLGSSTIHFGTLMVNFDDADGLVSGAVHSTADTIRPALQVIRTKPEIGLASSVFFMPLADRVLIYGDCAINPNPNPQELAVIAISSAQTARAFGIEPCVALLSYSTGASGKGEDVDKVSEALRIVKEHNPDFPVDGPLQYDAAVDMEVAKLKQPDSSVAGRANVLIFPDLDAGNIAYKAVQRSAGVVAVGPVMQGLRKPVNDLSRGCSVDDIVYTVAVTAIQAASS